MNRICPRQGFSGRRITQMLKKVLNVLEEQMPYVKKVKKTMYRQKRDRNKDRKSTKKPERNFWM